MKNIWLCGSSGMLGRHVSQLLHDRKMPFVGTTRQAVDITSLEDVSDFIRTQKITHVINCAAYTNVDRAEEEQKEAYCINALGPHHLGIAGRRYGARVLHFSTDYVFGGTGKVPYTEDHQCSPLGAYGMSKLAGEIKLLDEHQHACIIRTSWLFGHGGRNFVETILNVMREKEIVKVIYDQVGRPTYCADLAEVALDLLDEEGIFHFANAGETCWYQYAQEIHSQAVDLGEVLKVQKIEPISSEMYQLNVKRPVYSTFCTKKIEEFLGKKPRHWTEALRQYLNIRACL